MRTRAGRSAMNSLNTRLQVSGYWLVLITACVAVVILRRPDVVLNPQFWAEDGKIWFANVHNLGAWQSLFLPQNGYLQTLSRLVAGIAALVPMQWAPLVFNLAAIMVQILPVMLLNGGRGRALVPSSTARLVLSVLYLAQPYTTSEDRRVGQERVSKFRSRW